MNRSVPTYFLCPTLNYTIGSIDLGHIIVSPSDPSKPLNINDVVRPDPADIQTSLKSNYNIGNLKPSPGLYGTFLRVLGFGVINQDETRYEFDQLETHFFDPSDDYLRRAVQSSSIQNYLAGSRFKLPLYIVTGVKIVTGANILRSTFRGKGLEARVEAETTLGSDSPSGPMVTAGVEVAQSHSKTEDFENASSFVLAFRLQKLRWTRSKKRSNSTSLKRLAKFRLRREEAGVDDVRAAVAEEIQDNDETGYVILYSSESNVRGATI